MDIPVLKVEPSAFYINVRTKGSDELQRGQDLLDSLIEGVTQSEAIIAEIKDLLSEYLAFLEEQSGAILGEVYDDQD